MRGVVIAGLFAFLVASGSCDLNLCEESTDVNFKLGFYTLDDGKEFDSVVYDLTIYGIGREDSLLYDQAVAKDITLPLNPSADTSRFIISIDSVEDIFTVTYSRFVRLISHDCGFITEFEIQDIDHTHINIDSVHIIQPKVTNFEELHVKIYL